MLPKLSPAVLFLCLSAAVCHGQDQDPSRVPVKLNLVLSPGKGGDTIEFTTTGSELNRKKTRTPVNRDSVSSTQPGIQPKQMLVIPAEAARPLAEVSLTPENVFEELPEKAPLVQEAVQSGTVPPESGKLSDPEPVEEPPKPLKKPKYIAYKPSFSMKTGYRVEQMKWSISAFNTPPNILSELTWSDVESYTLSGDFRWSNATNLYVRGNVNVGWVAAGDVRDSDYLGDNRTQEFSRSYADAGGAFWDAGIGAGYRFDLPLSGKGAFLRFIPVAGWSYHIQEMEMTEGVQALAAYGWEVELGPFDGLQSSYDTKWDGPWLGIDFELGLNEKHSVNASFEYHWASFSAEANWNLRSDFAHPVSFRHEADGDGIFARIEYRYSPSQTWFWGVAMDYMNMDTDSGTDETYFADGSTYKAKLNELEWESFSILLSLGYYF